MIFLHKALFTATHFEVLFFHWILMHVRKVTAAKFYLYVNEIYKTLICILHLEKYSFQCMEKQHSTQCETGCGGGLGRYNSTQGVHIA